MKAWILDKPGGTLELKDVATPGPERGSAVVAVQAVPLLSYLRAYVEGKLPYWYPSRPFTPGSNGIGVITAVGDGVYHLKPGQRVVISPFLRADENVASPEQILIGLTGISAGCAPMLDDWADGTLRELARLPASSLTPLDGFDDLQVGHAVALAKFLVPLGGLVRGRLAAGEALVVNGATGAFGSAAVLLGIALGASRVVAVGRNAEALAEVVATAGPRAVAVALTGDVDADAKALRKAAGGAADLAFDMVGQARDARSTLAALKSLGRGGRLVLMGSMTAELPVSYGELLLNNWEVIGHFMYQPPDIRRLLALVRMGALDLGVVKTTGFPLPQLDAAMDAASAMKGLECVFIDMT